MSFEHLDALLPTLLELGAEPPSVSLDELGRRRVPSEFGDFRGHVAYAPGDDLRFLDWRVLARSGDKMLKRFDGVEHRRLVLHLDASASCRTRGAALAEITLLWILLGLQTLDSVELFVHGEDSLECRFEGPAEAERAREVCTQVQFSGRLDRARVGDALAGSPGSGAVMLSDFMPSSFWREVLERASAPGRSVLCVFGRSGLESGATDPRALRGTLRLQDPETGERLTLDGSKKLLQAFAEEQRAWESEMAAFCREHRHSFVAADLPGPETRRSVDAWLPFLVHRAPARSF